ncbi:hypothetical protein AN5765.2 [Aspergillus nidulans FGSC A4]|uniref:Uncharacterized protein n=1 Tax=Emericella nidulans (strain FGSC A4 / ATCC 38163 / CBS 112.46 / NRRL 194 / M139) TaxID=227321 RepID=Q5B115_EMENI|nr:hypothetical protein [Aspergillus nidulans FGSC A4]EAA62858.1 hypothetical protein AN5765.2 [Aspergillus nidulans FGSC A4]CBF81248.1 TPA: conserved hypothetical protein [Aspergillus nidulans FGSC A4]|eukprot:XP_663369.1 hypothetical protein AN5765.2 [Aspergillus nidulans FGSC A4]
MQLLSNGIQIVQPAFTEGIKNAVAYCQPVMESLPGLAALAAKWAVENPGAAASTVVGIAVIAAPGFVVSPTLTMLGFGPGDSLAATAQSVVGNVAAGSTFATLQSAGAGGAGLAVIDGAVQAGGLAVGIWRMGLTWIRARL